MIRNLKALGLALVAIFALSAMVASAASAQQGKLTSDGPFTLIGTEAATGNKLVYPGETDFVACEGSHFHAYKYNVTPHVGIPSGATTVTVIPTYTNCHAGLHRVTVTMNGCDYVFHLGVTTGGVTGTYGLTADLVCEAGHQVEVHVYLASNNSNTPICTFFFGSQSGLSGAHLTDSGSGTLTAKGTFTGIAASKSGLCGSGSTSAAEYEVNVPLTGENEAEGATTASISE